MGRIFGYDAHPGPLDLDEDVLPILYAAGATDALKQRVISPANFIIEAGLLTPADLADYVTTASLTTTLTGYFAKRADGGITAASTDTEHIFTLSHAPDDITKTNVGRVTNLAHTGASAWRFTDQNGREAAAVGFVNSAADGSFTATNVFSGNAYLEASNLDSQYRDYEAPGWAAVQTGWNQGGDSANAGYATRARILMARRTQDIRFYEPGGSGSAFGTVMGLLNRRGCVAWGRPDMLPTLQRGHLYGQTVATAPTAEPEYVEGNYAPWVWCLADNKDYRFKFNTKGLRPPDLNVPMDEAAGVALREEMFFGAGKLSGAGAGTIGTAADHPSGSGGGVKVFNRATGDQRFVQFTGGSAGILSQLTDKHFGHVRVKLTGAFGYNARLFIQEPHLQLEVNTLGRVSLSMSGVSIAATANTALTLDAWNDVQWYRDPDGDLLWLRVNGGTPETTPHTNVPSLPGTADIAIGGYPGGFNQGITGRMCDLMMWFGTILTSAQRDSLVGGTYRHFRWATGFTAPTGGSGSWLASGAYA